jgi:hypothetical protein
MPLLHISGLAGNNQPFSIAFSFTSDNSSATFSYSLKHLHSLFTTYQIPLPQLPLTIHNPDLLDNLDKIFPNTQHLLSANHIYHNIQINAKNLIKDSQLESKMLELWSTLIKKPTPSQLNDFYHSKIKYRCGYPSEFINFLDSTWIPLIELFTNSWTKNLPHFDHRSLQIHVHHKYLTSILFSKGNNYPETIESLSSVLKKEEELIRNKFSQKEVKTLQRIKTPSSHFVLVKSLVRLD